jgi:hypothetical protein
LLPPLFLDYRLDPQGGYDLPRYPSSVGPLKATKSGEKSGLAADLCK